MITIDCDVPSFVKHFEHLPYILIGLHHCFSYYRSACLLIQSHNTSPYSFAACQCALGCRPESRTRHPLQHQIRTDLLPKSSPFLTEMKMSHRLS